MPAPLKPEIILSFNLLFKGLTMLKGYEMLDEKRNITCRHTEGPFEYWKKSPEHQMTHCKICGLVLFVRRDEFQSLQLETRATYDSAESPDKGVDISQSDRCGSCHRTSGEFADIYSFMNESEDLQDLNSFNYDSNEKTYILELKEKLFSPLQLEKFS